MDVSVIVIEDSVQQRKKFSSILSNIENVNYEIFSCANEVLTHVLLYKHDIIISDIILPTIEGPEFIESAIKEGYKGKVILTSSINEKIVNKMYDNLSYDYFLSKPINENYLKEIISNCEVHE